MKRRRIHPRGNKEEIGESRSRQRFKEGASASHEGSEKENAVSDSIDLLALITPLHLKIIGATKENQEKEQNSRPRLVSKDLHQTKRAIRQFFNNDGSTPEKLYFDKVKEFVYAINVSINEERMLLALLKPITLEPTTEYSLGPQSESFMSMLLMESAIQARMTDILLEKLKIAVDQTDETLPPLLLKQFRLVPLLGNMGKMTQTLLSILPKCSEDQQKDFLSFLPEIVSDDMQSDVLETLEELMEKNPKLTSAVLGAFSDMNFDGEHLERISSSILRNLRSKNTEDVPTIVNFLLVTHTSPEKQTKVIRILRSSLEANERFCTKYSYDEPTEGKKVEKSVETVFLDTLVSIFRFRSDLVKLFLKEIDIETSTDEHEPSILDIWILFIARHLSSSNARVERILRRKIEEGVYTTGLFRGAVLGHGHGLSLMFRAILDIAELLLASKHGKEREVAGELFQVLFREFDEMYYQQELVISLIGRIGDCSRTSSSFSLNDEGDAIHILAEISRRFPLQLSTFYAFIETLFDYFHQLELSHVKLAYEILVNISAPENTKISESRAIEQLNVMLKKQLNSHSQKVKLHGLVGVTALLARLARSADPEDPKDAVKLFRNSHQACKDSSADLALFFGQMSALLRSTHDLHPQFVNYALDFVSKDFDSNFLKDIENSGISDSNEYELHFNLDGNDAMVYVPIFESVKEASTGSELQYSHIAKELSCLCACEYNTNKSLNELDGLLGCPVTLIKEDYIMCMDDLEKPMKEMICISLSVAVEFFTEAINGFILSPTDEMRKKILKRIENLVECEKSLEFALKHVEKPSQEVLRRSPELTNKHVPYLREEKNYANPVISIEAIKLLGEEIIEEFPKAESFLLSLLREAILQQSPSRNTLLPPPDKRSATAYRLFRRSERTNHGTLVKIVDSILPRLMNLFRKIGEGEDQQKDEEEQVNLVSAIVSVYQLLLRERGTGDRLLFSKALSSAGIREQTREGTFDMVRNYIEMSIGAGTTKISLYLLEMMQMLLVGSEIESSSTRMFAKDLLKMKRTLKETSERGGGEIRRMTEVSESARKIAIILPAKEKPQVLENLVRIELLFSEDELILLQEYCEIINGIGDLSESLPLADKIKGHFHIYYKVLLGSLLDFLIGGHDSIVKKSEEAALEVVRTGTIIFQHLVQMVRRMESIQNITVAMKKGKEFLDYFVTKAIPLLEKRFKVDQSSVVLIMKDLQVSTRVLQILCAHGKVQQCKSLIRLVPSLKKSMELLIFRVKAMLEVNDALEAFWMGNLKHKNLKGAEISSQVPSQTVQKNIHKKRTRMKKGTNSHVDEHSAEERANTANGSESDDDLSDIGMPESLDSSNEIIDSMDGV